MIAVPSTLLLLGQTAAAPANAAGGTSTASSSSAEYVVYELSRLKTYDDERLPIALISTAVIALVAVVWYLYHRDTIELSRSRRWAILVLRFVALAGLLVFFLGVERRIDHQVVHNSQVAVLIDTSQSMGLRDGDLSSGSNSTRLQAASNALVASPLLAEMRKKHDVHVARFERDVEPIITLPKEEPEEHGRPDTVRQNSPNAPSSLEKSASSPVESAKWIAKLQPRGTETRLGQALSDELRLYHGAPLAGIVVISDGAQN